MRRFRFPHCRPAATSAVAVLLLASCGEVAELDDSWMRTHFPDWEVTDAVVFNEGNYSCSHEASEGANSPSYAWRIPIEVPENCISITVTLGNFAGTRSRMIHGEWRIKRVGGLEHLEARQHGQPLPIADYPVRDELIVKLHFPFKGKGFGIRQAKRMQAVVRPTAWDGGIFPEVYDAPNPFEGGDDGSLTHGMSISHVIGADGVERSYREERDASEALAADMRKQQHVGLLTTGDGRQIRITVRAFIDDSLPASGATALAGKD